MQSASAAVPIEYSPSPMDARVQVRHAGLKVADLERTRRFYVDVLGFHVMFRNEVLMLLGAGDYHHDLSFWAKESRGGSPPPPEATGLDHIAILYPTKDTLADALRRLRDAQWPIEYVTDFPTHTGVHLLDPDGNMLELQLDKPVEEWRLDADGHLTPDLRPIAVEELLDDRDPGEPREQPAARSIGP